MKLNQNAGWGGETVIQYISALFPSYYICHQIKTKLMRKLCNVCMIQTPITTALKRFDKKETENVLLYVVPAQQIRM